jgi:cbb3-type cytochrome oxidase subunit 3
VFFNIFFFLIFFLGIFSSPHAHTLEQEKKKTNEEGKRGIMVLRVGGENGERRTEEERKRKREKKLGEK